MIATSVYNNSSKINNTKHVNEYFDEASLVFNDGID